MDCGNESNELMITSNDSDVYSVGSDLIFIKDKSGSDDGNRVEIHTTIKKLNDDPTIVQSKEKLVSKTDFYQDDSLLSNFSPSSRIPVRNVSSPLNINRRKKSLSDINNMSYGDSSGIPRFTSKSSQLSTINQNKSLNITSKSTHLEFSNLQINHNDRKDQNIYQSKKELSTSLNSTTKPQHKKQNKLTVFDHLYNHIKIHDEKLTDLKNKIISDEKMRIEASKIPPSKNVVRNKENSFWSRRDKEIQMFNEKKKRSELNTPIDKDCTFQPAINPNARTRSKPIHEILQEKAKIIEEKHQKLKQKLLDDQDRLMPFKPNIFKQIKSFNSQSFNNNAPINHSPDNVSTKPNSYVTRAKISYKNDNSPGNSINNPTNNRKGVSLLNNVKNRFQDNISLGSPKTYNVASQPPMLDSTCNNKNIVTNTYISSSPLNRPTQISKNYCVPGNPRIINKYPTNLLKELTNNYEELIDTTDLMNEQ